MTTHQLHAKARALALRLGITHSEACSRLARRGRRRTRKAAPISAITGTAQKQPASYWWQND